MIPFFMDWNPKRKKALSLIVIGGRITAAFEVIDNGVGMDAVQVAHLEELINRQEESVEAMCAF